MTPFILVSCLSAAENVNRVIKAHSRHPEYPGVADESQRRLTFSPESCEEELLTCIVGERPAILVEDEPALLPGLDLATHFDQEASAGFISDGQMEAGIWVVTGCLNMAVKIKVVFSYREVASQQPGLWKQH